MFAFEDVDGQTTIGIWFGAVMNGGLALYRRGEPVGFTDDPLGGADGYGQWIWADRPAHDLIEALEDAEILAELRRREYERGETGKAGSRPDAETRARAWMRTQRLSVAGEAGDRALARMAVFLVRGFRLEPDGAAFRLLSEYNANASPPWPEKKLREVLVWAEKNGRMPFGHLLDAPPRKKGRS